MEVTQTEQTSLYYFHGGSSKKSDYEHDQQVTEQNCLLKLWCSIAELVSNKLFSLPPLLSTFRSL